MSTFLIEVLQKEIFPDPLALAVEKDARALGIEGLGRIKVGHLYRITGNTGKKDITCIARALLADPVTQEYDVREEDGKHTNTGPALNRRVEVWFHTPVTDTVGETVNIGISDLGLRGISRVATGTAYIFDRTVSDTILSMLAKKLLANGLIQYCEYT